MKIHVSNNDLGSKYISSASLIRLDIQLSFFKIVGNRIPEARAPPQSTLGNLIKAHVSAQSDPLPFHTRIKDKLDPRVISGWVFVESPSADSHCSRKDCPHR